MKFSLTNDVAIHVTDIKQSAEFYKNTLGFEIIDENEDYVRLRKDVVNFYLNKSEKVIPPILSFSVEDIKAAKEYLTAKGFNIIVGSGESIYAKDINGIVFDFIEVKENTD